MQKLRSVAISLFALFEKMASFSDSTFASSFRSKYDEDLAVSGNTVHLFKKEYFYACYGRQAIAVAQRFHMTTNLRKDHGTYVNIFF